MNRTAYVAGVIVGAALIALAGYGVRVNKSIRADIAAQGERIEAEQAAREAADAKAAKELQEAISTNAARWEETDNTINALRGEIEALNAAVTAQEEAEEPEATETTTEGVDTSGWEYIGVKKLTAYEETGHNTASGVYPIEDESCASNELPFGTRLYIEGYGFWTVHDRGNMPWADLDLYLRTYDRCVQFGERTANVWIVK